MCNVNKCCLNCVYLKSGWCDLQGIVPYPPDKMDCANFVPKVNKISEVTENKKIIKQTVFDHIMQSVENLADKLVYEATTCDSDGHILFGYKTTLIPNGFWINKSEAITAIIKELKKEWKEKSIL